MGINRVQFQKGLSMGEFMNRYGTEEKCHAAVVAQRWPNGFVCPECGETRHCTFERKGLTYWQCSACREQTTVICGTVFEATNAKRRASWTVGSRSTMPTWVANCPAARVGADRRTRCPSSLPCRRPRPDIR